VDRAGAGAAAAEADPDPTGGSPGDLLVVATARDEPAPAPPLRALLSKVRSASSRRVRRVVLGPLTAEQTATVAQAVGPIDPELERAVVRGSGRVPFFVVHPLLVWRETGAIAWRDGAWRAVGGVDGPVFRQDVPGALDLIEARLASYFDLGSDRGRVALRALACVGLYGGGLGVEVLLSVAGDEAAVEGVLEVLVGGGILTVEGERQEYSFAQEMVRQAALNLVRQRPWFRTLHRALLDAVAAGPFALADAAFLAEGYQQIGAMDAALLWLRRAMDAALGAGLFSDAAELGDRLAALTPDAAERAEIELAIVRALVRGRKFEEARGRIERLSARAGALAPLPGGLALDVRRRIYALEVARGFRELHEDPDPALLDDADRAGDAALQCEARMALAGVLPEARAMELAGEAVRLAASCGPLLEVSARVLRFELCYDSSHRDLALAEEDLTRAVALAAVSSSPWQKLQIEGDLAAIEAETGRLDSAIERLGRLVESAEELKLRGQLRLFLQNLSALLLRAGRPAEAAEVAGRTAALAVDAGDPALRGSALSLRAEALKLAGTLAAALATADEAARIQRQHGDHALPLALLRRASILDALGRADAALADVREARRLAGLYGNKDLEIGARVAEKLSAARKGEIAAGELAQALAEAEGSGVTLRKVTLGIIASARDWIAGSSPTVPQIARR
jgi:tetratricopeptide (TPR) repeat protein